MSLSGYLNSKIDSNEGEIEVGTTPSRQEKESVTAHLTYEF